MEREIVDDRRWIGARQNWKVQKESLSERAKSTVFSMWNQLLGNHHLLIIITIDNLGNTFQLI